MFINRSQVFPKRSPNVPQLSQAGDMCQDFKTGHLLGTSPRKQLMAQLVGVPFGALIAVPIFALFTAAYPLGSNQLPAPAAQVIQLTIHVIQ
jgi:uncharacterized oligopeptide transporter (OPT) family protein